MHLNAAAPHPSPRPLPFPRTAPLNSTVLRLSFHSKNVPTFLHWMAGLTMMASSQLLKYDKRILFHLYHYIVEHGFRLIVFNRDACSTIHYITYWLSSISDRVHIVDMHCSTLLTTIEARHQIEFACLALHCLLSSMPDRVHLHCFTLIRLLKLLH